MVFTLHRYIFREAFRLFALATVALTVMLSIGSIIEPVQKYGVGPEQVVHLIGYSLPITLTFVLPMAALFSATLVYGRFAGDNELDACRASGISMLTLVYPGLLLAVMVAIANLVLSFHVMPAFVHRAQRSLKADAKQILFRNIQRKGYYNLPGQYRYRVYADHADPYNDTLHGVVVTELREGHIEKITTAETAEVKFDSASGYQQVRITAHNTYQMSPEGDAQSGIFVVTTEFPSLLGDDIKFKKINKMKQIAADPTLFAPVARLVRMAYSQFTVELLARDISRTIASQATTFYQLHSGTKFIEFTADECTAEPGEETVHLTGNIVVREYDWVFKATSVEKELVRTLRCSKALLNIQGNRLEPTLAMVLFNAMWRQENNIEVFDRRPVFRGLILPKNAVPRELRRQAASDQNSDISKLLLAAVEPNSVAAELNKEVPLELAETQKKLRREIRSTLAEIGAEIHSRLVFGIGCVPLIMIGIGLGIIKKDGHILTAFGVSAVPATILIICIMTGKNITKNPGAQADSGIMVIWLGLAILILLAAVVYRKLLRN